MRTPIIDYSVIKFILNFLFANLLHVACQQTNVVFETGSRETDKIVYGEHVTYKFVEIAVWEITGNMAQSREHAQMNLE